MISRDFDESRMLDKTLETQNEGVQNEVEHFIPGGLILNIGLEDVTPNGEVVDRNEEEVEENYGQLEQPQLPPSQDRPRRERRLPARLQSCVDPSTMRALITEDGEPTTFLKAIDDKDSTSWKQAMSEEMSALHKNKTWELVELPKGRKAVGCKWISKIKKGIDRKIERYRARLVAKGFAQEQGIDFI